MHVHDSVLGQPTVETSAPLCRHFKFDNAQRVSLTTYLASRFEGHVCPLQPCFTLGIPRAALLATRPAHTIVFRLISAKLLQDHHSPLHDGISPHLVALPVRVCVRPVTNSIHNRSEVNPDKLFPASVLVAIFTFPKVLLLALCGCRTLA